jgi:adenosine 3'-phospho 5'-phosphosulfate transporter B3
MSAILTFVTMCIGALQGGFRDRKAPLKSHLAVGALSCATVSLSNISLMYLNFATQVIFKSSKVIPVMIVGTVVWRKTFTRLQYCSALILVAGLVMVSDNAVMLWCCEAVAL